ncbi:MAG TPA: DUF6691 family protein [Solimonas sp.]|nr:DUF6691 family protein [Solimonas sp.]
MIARLAPLLSGLLFGGGLVLSGMADPARILAFLQLGPGWDPSLLLVMAGALAVALPGFAWLRRRAQPWCAERFADPRGAVDRTLLLGAVLFGAGWGLAGYCPGPALVSAGLLQGAGLLFVPAMLAGAALVRRSR